MDMALPLREAGLYSTHSSGSSTSSRTGPIPKRNKTRRSLDSSLTHSTRANRRGPRGKSLSNIAIRSKHPLRDLDLNEQNVVSWSPTQTQCQKSEDQYIVVPKARKEHDTYSLEDDLGKNSFGSDIFTSTNQQRLNGPGSQFSKGFNDDTTVDF